MGETWYPDSYVVVDLETTGLSPDKDKILEIGAVKVIGGKVTETFCTFCDPGGSVPYPVQQLTGITTDMVKGQKSPAEGVRDFLAFCGDLDLMGHNLIFDYSFLKCQAAAQKQSFEKKGIDTLKIARSLLPDLESRSLTSLCGFFEVDREHAHRAFHDALATHEIYVKLQEYAKEGQEELFAPKPLFYRPRRKSPITPAQKGYLKDLVKYHKIELDVVIDQMTKSEASRTIDTIISQYGRMKR